MCELSPLLVRNVLCLWIGAMSSTSLSGMSQTCIGINFCGPWDIFQHYSGEDNVGFARFGSRTGGVEQTPIIFGHSDLLSRHILCNTRRPPSFRHFNCDYNAARGSPSPAQICLAAS